MMQKKIGVIGVFALSGAAVFFNGCRSNVQKVDETPRANNFNNPRSDNGRPNNGIAPAPRFDDNDRSAFNMSAPLRPDARVTPGDTLDVTSFDTCVAGYSKKVRNVPRSVKNQAYNNYNITNRKKGEYEVDHLISLQLGGSNSIRNLWPQSYQTQPWNAYIKDALENELRRRVCDGEMTLPQAQRAISGDWIASYQKVFKTQLPLRKHLRNVKGNRLYKDDDDDDGN